MAKTLVFTAVLAGCLPLAQLACAGEPDPEVQQPASPVITPGKPKGAWQGEYPLPKPALPEGPSVPACEEEKQPAGDAATPGEPDERAGCGGAEPPPPD